jgi:type II secretory pathway pseudopilin PulG
MAGPRRTISKGQEGITLIELLVSMTILTVVTSMIILSWFALQSSSAQTISANDARSSARDALERMSIEIRSASASPGSSAGSAVFTVATPTEVDFYSSFNVIGQSSDGSGTDSLRLTRIYLDGTMPYQSLIMVRDTNNDGTLGNVGDQQMVLATNVVNNSIPSTSSPTAVFTYGYRDSGGDFQVTTTIPSASAPTVTLASIISVNIRVLVDKNLNHKPATVDLQTIVRPQNAPRS